MTTSPSISRAFSSLGCPELTLEETLALAERHGIDAVELRTLGDTTDLTGLFARTYGSPAALAGRLRGARVKLLALDTSLGLVAPSAAEREAFLAFVPWAEAAGVPWLRVFDAGRNRTADSVADAAATLRWWQEERRRHGWRTEAMVETHDILLTADALRRFAELAPGAAILWDAHNTWRGGGTDPAALWPAIKSRVVHLHVKDSISRPSGPHPYRFVLPGTGEFPMAPLREALRADRYAGAISLEWERKWHPELPPLDEALASAADRRWW